MPNFSRRSLITGMAMVPFALWLEKLGLSASMKPFVRYEAHTTEGQAMLKIYAEAVDKMINQIKEGDPKNWVFQWYTHWVRPDRTKAGEIQRIYGASGNALAQAMWETCQNHSGAAGMEDFFLPWHRMFVYYFESIIRVVSGHSDFTLPYWNYSASQSNAAIPTEFRSGSNAQFKSLYRANRNNGVNGGQPIASSQQLDPTQILKQSTYSPSGVQPGFNMMLDSTLHGTVHVQVGDGTNMGSIPWAAEDPVFWMHHCNIDRLWATWNQGGGKNPTTSTWLDKTFTFADSVCRGVQIKVSEVDEISKLDYTYDSLERLVIRWPLVETTPLKLETVSNNISLTKAPLHLPLAVAPENKTPKWTMTDHVQKLATNQHLLLVLKGFKASVQPGVLYDVYIDLPQGAKPTPQSPNYVGTINFFDAVPHSEQHASAGSQKFVTFDITEAAQNLKQKGALQPKTTVSLIPAGEPDASAQVQIDDISVFEQ